jgi:hypothetical protein
MKKRIFLSESDVLFGNNSYLKNRLSVTKEDVENGYISDLWYDCDHVKINGESGRGDVCFITVENKSVIYIIGLYDFESEEEDVVNWWLDGAKDEIEINNTWDDWDKVKTGIAYRGGSGYCYSLYAKELK